MNTGAGVQLMRIQPVQVRGEHSWWWSGLVREWAGEGVGWWGSGLVREWAGGGVGW